MGSWLRFVMCLNLAMQVACGGDDDGPAGDGGPIPVTNQLVVGSNTACVIRANGDLFCWGRNGNGELDGSLPGVVPVPAQVGGGVVEVGLGSQHSCRLLADRTMDCRGYNLHGETSGQQFSGIKVFGGGPNSGCVVLTDNSVRCWGSNTNDEAPDTVAIDGSSVTELFPNAANTCARMSNGSVQCWGNNVLVFGDYTNGATPIVIPELTGAVELETSHQDICARFATGAVTCSGSADPIGFDGPVQLSAGGIGVSACVVTGSGSVQCWGSNLGGKLGDGTMDDTSTPVTVAGITDAISVGVGSDFACAMRRTGQVMCWGNNSNGQLGDGTTTPHLDPQPIAVF